MKHITMLLKKKLLLRCREKEVDISFLREIISTLIQKQMILPLNLSPNNTSENVHATDTNLAPKTVLKQKHQQQNT